MRGKPLSWAALPWVCASATPMSGRGHARADLQPPDYPSTSKGVRPSSAVLRMARAHNRTAPAERGATGPNYKKGVCAPAGTKTHGNGGNWTGGLQPRSPQGLSPCHSRWVYDLNGNAAEHMNLPLGRGQMSSRGSPERALYRDQRKLVYFRYLSRP